jgi:glycosyltransferase involved in cell wall biosynthesis
MSNIRCLYVAMMDVLSGGNNRRYEFLKRSGKFGVDYIPVLESVTYPTALRSYPDLPTLMSQLGGYTIRMRDTLFRPFYYSNILKAAEKIAIIARKEKVDLIASVHESFDTLQAVRIASKICKIPWTVIMNVNPIVSDVTSVFSLSRLEEVARTSGVSMPIALFKFARLRVMVDALSETLSLSASPSISYELKFFEPRLSVRVLDPPGGIEPPWFEAEPKSCGCDAMFFARLDPKKGIFELPYVWKKVTDEIPEAKLGVAGPWSSEDNRLKFNSLCAELQLGQSIVSLGLLPRNLLHSYLKSVRLMVYPSFADAFPIVVVESLACGVPVVTYNINPIRFNYGNSRAVIRIEPRNREQMAKAIIEILRDDNFKKSISSEAIKFASKYTWENAVKEEASAFRDVLSFFKDK